MQPIKPGLVNEYELRLGRQRQVWFIPLADERAVCTVQVKHAEATHIIIILLQNVKDSGSRQT